MDIARVTLGRVAFFSFFINLLMLVSSIYMLQVYDRVLASRSGHTLFYLSLLAAGCMAVLALLRRVRGL
jgi:ABC-type protease/lipase transport system fused ATPase/permease subunit